MPILPWSEYQTEKSPSAHVWNCKIRLECRVMSPFVFADRYDPKEVYKHTCLALDTNTKFFRDPQSQVSHPSKSNFLGGLISDFTTLSVKIIAS